MPFVNCVYHKCKNNSRNISMFRFPIHDKERLLLWIRNSGNLFLDSLTEKELSRRYVCAAHFPPSSIHKASMRTRLIGPAIPVHFKSVAAIEDSPQDLEDTNANVDDGIVISPEVLKVKKPTKFYRKVSKSSMEVETSELSTSPPTSTAMDVDMATPRRFSSKCLFEGPKKRFSRKCLFEKNVKDTPKTKCLKESASKILKKNKAQRVHIMRLKKKSKQCFKKEDFPSEFAKTLVVMQNRKKGDKKKWTEEEKNLCLSLFYKSPATYKFLRRQGVVLAAPTTIRMWLKKSDCLPGLCLDTLKKIQKRFENASLKDKACVICFDEMSIMESLDYEKKYDYIEGFEDFGGNHRNSKLAKYTLVFLVRSLYGQWKLPVAYFLSSSNVKAENLQLIIKSLINKLFEHGLLPKIIVCDQATTNQNVFRKLGVTTEAPFFYCNNRKIFAIFDVPHLIKSIRNNLITNDFVIDNEQITFKDIIRTYEIDKMSQTSRTLTKITDRHISPNAFQKMTVSLATQIFSNSVAAAIKTAKQTNQLESETAFATAKFVLVVNNMFDALNSKNQFDNNPFRHALSKNSTYALNAITEAKNLFQNLYKIVIKNKDAQKKLSRPPCFDGVVQTCQAVLLLLEEELTDKNIKYIITKKLNQDVLENLFARIRQKGGFNRNPSSKLLRLIFRSNLINSLVKLPNTKNCEDEDGEFLKLLGTEPVSGSIQIFADLSAKEIIKEPVAGPSGYCQIKEPVAGPSDYCQIKEPVAGPSGYCQMKEPVAGPSGYCQIKEPVAGPSGYCQIKEPVAGPSGYCQMKEPVAGPSGYCQIKEPVAGPSGYCQKEIESLKNTASTSATPTSLEDCSIAYFAGYLAKACLDKTNCHDCTQNLIKQELLDDEKQLLILNKSYNCNKSLKLKVPSDNLYKLIRLALDCFNINFSNIMHSKKIKFRLFNAIVNFLKCEAPELLKISCETHLFYIIEHMILVKIHFYCKNVKRNSVGKAQQKLKILKNK